MEAQKFPKSLRLLSRPEYDRVFAYRCSSGDANLVCFVRPRAGGESRLGLVVPRKVKSAVRRNRAKRLCREAFRLRRHELPRGLDIVLIPQRVEGLKRQDVETSLLALCRRSVRKMRKRQAMSH